MVGSVEKKTLGLSLDFTVGEELGPALGLGLSSEQHLGVQAERKSSTYSMTVLKNDAAVAQS